MSVKQNLEKIRCFFLRHDWHVLDAIPDRVNVQIKFKMYCVFCAKGVDQAVNLNYIPARYLVNSTPEEIQKAKELSEFCYNLMKTQKGQTDENTPK